MGEARKGDLLAAGVPTVELACRLCLRPQLGQCMGHHEEHPHELDQDGGDWSVSSLRMRSPPENSLV